MISKGFYEELVNIANEKHLELEDVFNVVTTAMIKACKLEGAKGEVTVEFNEEQKKALATVINNARSMGELINSRVN